MISEAELATLSELSGAQMWETAAEEGERAGLQALEVS
jgi:hypothetical protein